MEKETKEKVEVGVLGVHHLLLRLQSLRPRRKSQKTPCVTRLFHFNSSSSGLFSSSDRSL
ncbi:hypothetical protein TYRP_015622 [Tyrophagus putrescentiae]|nr:hypothetical protein TYRP_015622 [Tyrophagus putrescentiae]